MPATKTHQACAIFYGQIRKNLIKKMVNSRDIAGNAKEAEKQLFSSFYGIPLLKKYIKHMANEIYILLENGKFSVRVP